MSIKKIVITALMVLLCVAPAFAGYVDRYTKDADIRPALVLLHNIGAQEVFDNLDENGVKVAFYDLSQISYRFMNAFAINSIDSFGNRYILLNSKFKNSSPEEIACLIAHESFHKSKVSTLEEETIATQKEAYYWSLLRDNEKVYKHSALLSRLNTLVILDTATDCQRNLIRERISSSAFYREQLAMK